MITLGLLLLAFSTPQEDQVKLIIESDQFVFLTGSVTLVDIQELSFELQKLSPRSQKVVRKLELMDGSTPHFQVEGVGDFSVRMSGLDIARRSDGAVFRVSHFPEFGSIRFTLKTQELDAGVVRIKLYPDGVFRVRVLDKQDQPLPGQLVKMRDSGGSSYRRFSTNEDGEFYLLEDPSDFWFEVNRPFRVEITEVVE